jgi:transketolase
VRAPSRQGLPVLDPQAIPDDAIERGGYVLVDCDGEPDVVLIGTGSEVSLCVEAAEQLSRDGIAVRVVSMPCVDRFAELGTDEQETVIASAGTPRIAVEAASPIGWDRFVGENGAIIAMHTFGASAPAADVYRHFGITAEAIVSRARELLQT